MIQVRVGGLGQELGAGVQGRGLRQKCHVDSRGSEHLVCTGGPWSAAVPPTGTLGGAGEPSQGIPEESYL